jgi:hypothetical protein
MYDISIEIDTDIINDIIFHRDTQVGKLTTHEVLLRSGITSVKTLTRWHQKGLIPPPAVETHPSGRGKIAYWPAWIIFRIREVKAGLAAGSSLDELASTLSRDWQAEEKRWVRKRPDIKAAFDRMNRAEAIDRFAEWAADAVFEYLQKIGVQRPGRVWGDLWANFYATEFVNDVLQLLRKGYSPVVAIAGSELKVIPDFLLASVAADPKSQSQPLLIVPIREAFLEAFAEAAPRLPKTPKYGPAPRLVEHGDSKRRQRMYRKKGQWDFVLEE